MDLDSLFHYSTNRRIIVKSRSLGLIRLTGWLIIFAFWLYVRLYTEKRYLELEPVDGTFTTRLGPPDINDRKKFSDLPYCLDNHSEEGSIENDILACVNIPYDALNALAPFETFFATIVKDTVEFDLDCYQGPEYTKREEYEMCLDGPGGDYNFLANIESFKLHIQHTVNGRDGEKIRHTSLDSAVECHDGITIPVKKEKLARGQFDTIMVDDMLRCAGVSLDSTFVGSVLSVRKEGAVVSLAIKYDNDQWGTINKYTYQFTHFKAQSGFVVPDSFRGVKSHPSPWGARRRRRTTVARRLNNKIANGICKNWCNGSAEKYSWTNICSWGNCTGCSQCANTIEPGNCKNWCNGSAEESSWKPVCKQDDCKGCSQCDIDNHPLSANKFETYAGIHLKVKQSGYSGEPNFYTFMISWVATMALVGIVGRITDFLMLYVLPAKKVYREYKFVETIDFSDFKDGEVKAVHGVNALIKANATYAGREHCRKYRHHMDKSASYRDFDESYISNDVIANHRSNSDLIKAISTLDSTIITPSSDRSLGEKPCSDYTDRNVEFSDEQFPHELGKAVLAMETRFDSALADLRAELDELRASQQNQQEKNPNGSAHSVNILVKPTPSIESEANISQQIGSRALEDRLWQLEASIGNLRALEAQDIPAESSRKSPPVCCHLTEPLKELACLVRELHQAWKTEFQSTVLSLKEDLIKREYPEIVNTIDAEQWKQDVDRGVAKLRADVSSIQFVVEHFRCHPWMAGSGKGSASSRSVSAETNNYVHTSDQRANVPSKDVMGLIKSEISALASEIATIADEIDKNGMSEELAILVRSKQLKFAELTGSLKTHEWRTPIADSFI